MQPNTLSTPHINIYLHNQVPEDILKSILHVQIPIEHLTLTHSIPIHKQYYTQVSNIINGSTKHKVNRLYLKDKIGYETLYQMFSDQDHRNITKNVFILNTALSMETEQKDLLEASCFEWKRELDFGVQSTLSYCDNILRHLPKEHHDILMIIMVAQPKCLDHQAGCSSIIHSIIRKINHYINETYGHEKIHSELVFYDPNYSSASKVIKHIQKC